MKNFHKLKPVRFHRAESVNFMVISTVADSVFSFTIFISLAMYSGFEPILPVSDVGIYKF